MHETERAENRIQTENKGGTRHTETEDNKNSETVAWKTREEIMGIATRKKKMVGGEKNRKLKKKKKDTRRRRRGRSKISEHKVN